MSDQNNASNILATSDERLQAAVAKIYATCKDAATCAEVSPLLAKVLLDQADELADAFGDFQIKSVSPSSSQHSPSTSLQRESLITTCSQEESNTFTAQAHERWAELLHVYPPRRGGCNKVKAEKTFKRLTVAEQKACIAGAEIYRKTCDTLGKTRTEYVCMLTTFINQRRWVELLEDPVSQDANKSLILAALEVGNHA